MTRAAGDTAKQRRAFTMVEIVLAMAVIAVIYVAVLNTVGASRMTLLRVGEQARAEALAEDLMAEILGQAYRDPDQPDSFGPTGAAAATGDRSLFNDVDDYDGWSAQPPEDRNGQPLSQVDRFERSVAVTWVDPAAINEPAEQDTGVKRIAVTVRLGGGVLAERVAWRTDGLRTEVAP